MWPVYLPISITNTTQKNNSPGDLHNVYDLFSVAMGEQLGEEEQLQNTHWHWPENERRMQVMPAGGPNHPGGLSAYLRPDGRRLSLFG